MKVQGQCHCGAIVYEAEVTPGTITVCNCADCQMQSGSVFRMNISTPADKFILLKGSPKKYVKTGSSGAKRIHAFCEHCGGPIFSSAAESPQSFSLRVGSLKQRYQLGPPTREIWTIRRFPWLPGIIGAEEFAEQP